MKSCSRRSFVRHATLLAAAGTLTRPLLAAATPGVATAPAATLPRSTDDRLRWLDGAPPKLSPGTTWGRCWPRALHPAEATFTLRTEAGAEVPLQSWPLAYWPDGSLKWTAHAIPGDAPLVPAYEIVRGTPLAPSRPVTASQKGDEVVMENGLLRLRVSSLAGKPSVDVIREGQVSVESLSLVCRVRGGASGEERTEELTGEITRLTLEQAGPVRAVVKVEGRHRSSTRTLIPYVLRLHVQAGTDCIRLVNTIIYDADPARDFIHGLGVRVRVPLRGALHDRHVRFAGVEQGVFGEAVRGVTGLRRDPGAAVKLAQFEGRATPPTADWSPAVATRLDYIPAYDDWTLLQASCDGFEIQKRTQQDCAWISAARGQRAGGLAYLGTPSGGVAFGLKDFWQSYPAQIDLRHARRDVAEVTLWTWAPDAPAMDLRPYHDGLGQDTFEKQYNGGLEITYEDYEPGFNTPEGVARTSELHLWCLAATPSREQFAEMQRVLAAPPLLISSPDYLHRCEVFGKLWTPAGEKDSRRAQLETQLAAHFEFYQEQREERRWYGFWNYGDVMHTYDEDRHEWRYDIGGFAWDNSELSTDLWLWLYFLKTGRADVFRFAEAMTRHTGEVDVHHSGRFAPLGSRHNVQHWGCSAKQLRISTALNRRYYYYLTGDERVGDLMSEQVEAGWALQRVPPGRKLGAAATKGDLDRGQPKNPDSIGLSVGTDWGSLAGAWLTEWERTRDPVMRDRLLAGMRTIGAQPFGFYSVGLTMNLRTGAFEVVTHRQVGVSHLNAVFGLVEVCAELIQLLEVPEFERAWLQYCELYSAPRAEQERVLGAALKGNGLEQGHARLTAYAAHRKKDAALAERAWRELLAPKGGQDAEAAGRRRRLSGASVLRPVHEAPGVSTNGTAQWGLAAIQCLALLD